NVSFAMLLLASFPIALGTYTYRSDLALLLPMPVNSVIIFAEKLLGATLRQHLLVLPLLVPYLLGLGVGLHLSPAYYLVSAVIVGNVTGAVLYLVALITLNVGVFLGALATAQRAFSTGWADYQETARRQVPTAGRQTRLIMRLLDNLPLASRGLLAKEWIIFM